MSLKQEYVSPDLEIPKVSPASPLRAAKVCTGCGGLVIDQDVHNGFHVKLERVADDARYAGVLRPLA